MYQQVAVGISTAAFAANTYLNWRQYSRNRSETKPSAAVQTYMSQKEFDNARSYALDRMVVGQLSATFDFLISLLLLSWRFFPAVWAFSQSIGVSFLVGPKVTPVVFSFTVMFLQSVASIPFSLVSCFWVEKKHGFNKTTVATFAADLLKSWMLSLVLGFPVALLLVSILAGAGQHLWLTLWAFFLVTQVFLILIFPTFIQPLFNKFTPVASESSLERRICALAKRVSFPLKGIFVCDASLRSSHSNAYFYGVFGQKRIVLFDTLVKDHPEDEIEAVLAHEIGHWHHSHVSKAFVIVQLHLLVVFFLFNRYFLDCGAVYHAFGIEFTRSTRIFGFLMFLRLMEPLDMLMTLFCNWATRKHEFQADLYAARLGYSERLAAALIRLQIENRSGLTPDPWYATYHHSHPTVVERIQVLQKFD